MEEEKKDSKRLNESNWMVIVALWERGEVTLSELSDRFGISKAALSQGLKRRGAVRGSKAHVASKRIQDKIESEKEKLIEEIYEFKKRYVKHGEYLTQLAMDTLKKHNDASTLSAARNEIASIAEATKVYKSVRNDLFFLYGLYDKEKVDGENYDFNIGVYSDKDIEAIHEANKFIEQEDRKFGIGPDEEDDNDGEEDDRVFEGEDE